MKPGKELNEKVAKEVMGMQQHPDFPHLWKDPSAPTNPFMPVPDFSGDIGHAWKVVENISMVLIPLKDGRWLSIAGTSPVEGDEIYFTKAFVDSNAQATAPLAICLAAIKTLEIKP